MFFVYFLTRFSIIQKETKAGSKETDKKELAVIP